MKADVGITRYGFGGKGEGWKEEGRRREEVGGIRKVVKFT